MKKSLFLFFLATSLYGAAPVEHHFSLEADYLWMKRMKVDNKLVVGHATDQSFRGNASVLGTMVDLTRIISTGRVLHDFTGESGFRIIATYTHDQANAAEARVYGGFNWTGKKSAQRTDDLYYPFSPNTTTDYYMADEAEVRYDSRLFSVDATYWLWITPRRVNYFSTAWNIGPRFINLDEKFKNTFTRDSSTSNYTIFTENKLMGAQTGGALELNPFSRLTLSFQLRVAGYANRSERNVKLRDQNNSVKLLDFTQKRTNFAYSYEFSPNILFWPWKHVMIKMAYEWLFVHRATFAPNQLITNKRPQRYNPKLEGFARYESVVAGLAIEF